jgi:malic enzyme-like protein
MDVNESCKMNSKTSSAYILPGVGLGITISRSRLVPSETFLIATETLADQVSEADRAEGRIYPPALPDSRNIAGDRNTGGGIRLRSGLGRSAATKGCQVVHKDSDVRTKLPGLHPSLASF